jgi:hypothetical protein
MPGDGPTWISGLAVARGARGVEGMFAGFVKVRNFLDVYRHGLVRWNDARAVFEEAAVFPEGQPIYPDGHTLVLSEPDGTDYLYFCTPFPHTRVRATSEALADLARYEGFTCLKAGTRADQDAIDRDAEGRPRYSWKAGTPPLSWSDQERLLKAGLLKPGEALARLVDIETGKAIRAHGGSVAWNPFRRRWVMIAVEAGGTTSFLGEVWFAEADAPTGPWAYARKVATHEKYSYYNPKHHAFLDQQGGRVIHFEGTYTATFSGNPVATPRYDYNQVMYRLDLADSRLALPMAIDLEGAGQAATRSDFFALEHPGEGTLAARREADEAGVARLRVSPSADAAGQAVFHMLAASVVPVPAGTALLYANEAEGKPPVYLLEDAEVPAGHRRIEPALGRVWRSPVGVELPGRRAGGSAR